MLKICLFHCALWSLKVYTQTKKVNGRLGGIIVSAERRKLQSDLRRILMRSPFSPEIPQGSRSHRRKGAAMVWKWQKGFENLTGGCWAPGSPLHLLHVTKWLLFLWPPTPLVETERLFSTKREWDIEIWVSGSPSSAENISSGGIGAEKKH